MSRAFNDQRIPIEEIQTKAVKAYFKKIMPRMDVEKWVVIINETKQYTRNPRWFDPKSVEDLPEYKNVFANDTSAVVGVWPLTLAENLTMELEGLFYNQDQSPKYEFIGQDIKVMIVREKNHYNIIMCIPFFAQEISNFGEYMIKKEEITNTVKGYLDNRLHKLKAKYDLFINTQDQNVTDETTVKKLYFVAGGSSTDFGEEGCVGRGNNRNGFIPMFRTFSMEAAWGKNPVYHVGKVFGLVVDNIAKEVSQYFDCKAEVLVITRNGDPFFAPHNIIINTSKVVDETQLDKVVRDILEKRDWTEKLVYEKAILPKTNNLE
jgi:S-adenosylmethionine synthetase